MGTEFGQHVGRQERIEEYSQWSGATPVDGEKRADMTPQMLAKAVEDAVAQIRMSFSAGCKKVVYDCQDAALVAAIKARLTEEERDRVAFGTDSPV